MIAQELRDRIKDYNSRSHHSFGEIVGTLEWQSQMSFTDEADLGFELIDFFYSGEISMIIADMRIVSSYGKFSRGYEHGKAILSRYVGWYAKVSKEKHPALCTEGAYKLIMSELSKACWKGHDEWRKRKERQA